MAVVVSIVMVAVPVVMGVVVLVVVMVVVVVMVMAMVMVMVVVMGCVKTKKNGRLVYLGLSLHFRISNLPSFACPSFKVLVDEFMTETACVCQAGDPKNYDI